MILKLSIFLSLIFLVKSDHREEAIVETNVGKVEGFLFDLENGHKAEIFLGIPFAKPPIGELRFEKPQPAEPWTGIREAKEWGAICYPHVILPGWVDAANVSEDCLTLNVFRPHKSTPPKDGSPVLVWVHGGGFSVGSAFMFEYEGLARNFIPHDLIVVSIQYRLGPLGIFLNFFIAFLGFSSTGDETLPGNLGFWDQAAAFKWIHENIRSFGGDPNKVTAWGESAGGASVSGLSMSPYSRDYISQTIEMSGSMFSAWGSHDNIVEHTHDYVKILECDCQDSKKVKDCLKSKSIEEILNAVLKSGPAKKGIETLKFHPRVDGDFFPDDFSELIKNGPQKLAMIGFTNIESALFAFVFGNLPPFISDVGIPTAQYSSYGLQNFTQFIREDVAKKQDFGEAAREVQEKLIEFYAKLDNYEKADSRFYLEKYCQLLTDAHFIIPGLLTAHHKMQQNWPVFLYLIEHENSQKVDPTLPVKGFVHAGENPYLFGKPFMVYQHWSWDDDERKVQKIFIENIVNFVKTGDPSMKSLKWPKLTEEHPLRYLSIKPEPEIKEMGLEDRWKLWTELRDKYSYDILRRHHRNVVEKHQEL